MHMHYMARAKVQIISRLLPKLSRVLCRSNKLVEAIVNAAPVLRSQLTPQARLSLFPIRQSLPEPCLPSLGDLQCAATAPTLRAYRDQALFCQRPQISGQRRTIHLHQFGERCNRDAAVVSDRDENSELGRPKTNRAQHIV